MLELMPESRDTFVAMRACGVLTRAERNALLATLEDIVEGSGGAISLVLDYTEVESLEPGVKSEGLWFDLRYGWRIGRVALIGGPQWDDEINRIKDLYRFAVVRRFDPAERDAGLRWGRGA